MDASVVLAAFGVLVSAAWIESEVVQPVVLVEQRLRGRPFIGCAGEVDRRHTTIPLQ